MKGHESAVVESAQTNLEAKMKEALFEETNQPQREASPRLIPLTQWNKFHPWPPLGGLRHLAFFSKRNGFEKVLRRVGRRVLIDERAFFAFVKEKTQES